MLMYVGMESVPITTMNNGKQDAILSAILCCIYVK